MIQSSFKLVMVASAVAGVDQKISAEFEQYRSHFVAAILNLLTQEISAENVFQFELELEAIGKKLLRMMMEMTLNQLEPADPEEMPRIIRWESGQYRRENEKSPNRYVATRFGNITLWRFRYRFRQRESEPAVFPLEIRLGLVGGATPAFADTVTRYMADTGTSQQRVIECIQQEHDVRLGVDRLRRITSDQAERMNAFRHQFQVARILELLQIAHESSGDRKPVLTVGRDGISVCNQPHGFWEVASVGTVTVYDRRGKRLGTVYLARMPESLQVELTRQLKHLLEDVLAGCDHPFPRLCYVTDAGDNESNFYSKVLRYLRDPRNPARRLQWIRIVDYYHATERITTMAEQIFGKESRDGSAWSRRMRNLLLKPNGASRVLHSAAALLARRNLSKAKQKEFRKAYNYLRTRTRMMRYHAYRHDHLPIGSGITEAACKTVFTQRLKLSGMRWSKKGGQTILDLRTLRLSRIWDPVRDAMLKNSLPNITVTYGNHENKSLRTAA